MARISCAGISQNLITELYWFNLQNLLSKKILQIIGTKDKQTAEMVAQGYVQYQR